MKSLENSEDRAEILGRLDRLRPDASRRWGRMSAHQTVCHLSDSFRLGLGERAASRAGGFAHQTILKWLALWAPVPWPRGYPTRPEMDQMIGGTPPEEFDRDIADLRTVCDRFCEEDPFTAVHPLFGVMTRTQWLRWGWLHMDHHLRQFGL